MNRFIVAALAVCGIAAGVVNAKEYTLSSPDGHVRLTVDAGKRLTWSLMHDSTTVIAPSPISLSLSDGKVLGASPRVKKVSTRKVDTSFATPFYKKSEVKDVYNELTLRLSDGLSVIFRAYDDGAAYRLSLDGKGARRVTSEEAVFNFAGDYKAFIPYVNDLRDADYPYSYSFESYYDESPISEMYADSLAIVPLLVELPHGKKALIMEGDVEGYPGMFLVKGKNANSIEARFAPEPLSEKIGGFSELNLIPVETASYIAEIEGTVTLPWRAVTVATSDSQLADSDMAQRLASPSRIADTSWIKPGKVAWDWWNNWNVTGVDFPAGINTPTYKYYIDFAAENGLEYIIIDEGWSRESLMSPVEGIDIAELARYGKEKGVGVILWARWRDVDKEMDVAFPHYAGLGIAGFKVDFFDRDDRRVIESMTRIADAAARNRLLLDLHGMKATGIQRTYPNVVNFEGVKGLENYKWLPVVDGKPGIDVMRYDVTAPFIRMAAGPMDYTPGAMTNAAPGNYRSINDTPMSFGTRAHQLAMYVVYEAPLQMLADSPGAYRSNPESLRFISAIPTVFDETRVLAGEVGEYIAVARRKGDTWYVGALTSLTPRDLKIPLSFLAPGVAYNAVTMSDGVNVNRNGADCRREERRVTSCSELDAAMASGGGFAAIITPAKQSE
ncbi:MAG: glycoside hydrolase family 97 protein [Candidatus Homeothermus sp.]|nr:glycoside hydrolase family 97 protein [Candidatus Homeothermus sp.]